MRQPSEIVLTEREALLLSALPPRGLPASPLELVMAGKLDDPSGPRARTGLGQFLTAPSMTGYHRTYARLVKLGLVQRYRADTRSPVEYRTSSHGDIWRAAREREAFLRSLHDLNGASVTPRWLVQVQKLPKPQPELDLTMQDYAGYHGVFGALAGEGLVHPDGRSARGDQRYRLTVKGRERLTALGM